MSWPQPGDFIQALAHPLRAFQDADLRRGSPFLDERGVPRVFAGDSADVFQVRGTCDSWAVKCYRQDHPDLKLHYRALNEHFRGAHAPWLVDARYLPHGISVGGRAYPMVKMRWAEGVPLHAYVKEHLHDPRRLRQLAQQWQQLAANLRLFGVAHGALQPGHVLVAFNPVDDVPVLRLIDHDAFFVPALERATPLEFGDGAFQHPRQLGQHLYDAEMDRFPQLVIFTALHALAVGGAALWQRCDTGGNLLFREADYLRPATSGVFRELWHSPDALTRTLTGQLLLASQGAPGQVPLLSELLSEAAPWAAAVVAARPLTPAQEKRIAEVLGDRPGDAPPVRSINEEPRLELPDMTLDEPTLPPPPALPLPESIRVAPPPLPAGFPSAPPPLPSSTPTPPPIPVLLTLAESERPVEKFRRDDRAAVYHLEAWMPERVALVKLQGFVDANSGTVIDSLPGLVRVHLLDPHELANPPGQGVWSWLGLVEPPPAPPPRVLAVLELHMEHKEMEFKKLLKCTVRFLPGEGRAQALNYSWRRFCDKMFCELRGFLMGGQ